MAKNKTAYVCTQCGADYSKWQGQCSACQEWNTISEVRLGTSSKPARDIRKGGYAGTASDVQSLDAIDVENAPRVSTGMGELDRVLGGGRVADSAIQLGGHPGAGKSTLLLRTMCYWAGAMPAL